MVAEICSPSAKTMAARGGHAQMVLAARYGRDGLNDILGNPAPSAKPLG